MKCLVRVPSSLVLAASFYVLYMSHSSGPICLLRTIQGGGGYPSTVKPAKKSFVMVMFQCSVSNLLSHLSSIAYNVFCSFPNSFPKVSVVNMVHRQKKGSNVHKSSFGGKTKAQVCRPDVYA